MKVSESGGTPKSSKSFFFVLYMGKPTVWGTHFLETPIITHMYKFVYISACHHNTVFHHPIVLDLLTNIYKYMLEYVFFFK